MGSCGSARGGGPPTTLAPDSGSNFPTWHGQTSVVPSASDTMQPACVHTFEYAAYPLTVNAMFVPPPYSDSGNRTSSVGAFSMPGWVSGNTVVHSPSERWFSLTGSPSLVTSATPSE